MAVYLGVVLGLAFIALVVALSVETESKDET